MKVISRIIIPPQQGKAFLAYRDQFIKIIDVEGKQVADFMAINWDDHGEIFSAAVTLDVNGSIHLKPGDFLYSNKYNKLLEIIDDKVGKHDLLHPSCSQRMYEIQYKSGETHPSCHENLESGFLEFNVRYNTLNTPFNIFMNSSVQDNGVITIQPPISKSGDYIVLRSCLDVVVSVAACSVKESACNNFSCKPIGVEILEPL